MTRRHPALFPLAPARAAVVTLTLSAAALLSGGSAHAATAPPPLMADQHDQHGQQASSSVPDGPYAPDAQGVQGVQGGSGSQGVREGASAQDPWGPGQDAVGTADTALKAPGDLRAEATSPTTARLTWQSASGAHDVAGYRVFQQGTSTPVADVAGDTLTVEIGSLEPGISYTFAVQAVGTDGRSSEAASQVELTMPERPADKRPALPPVAR